MDPQKNSRCPHYQIYSEALEMSGPPAYLAIRRCLLTERMIRLLQQSEEGNRLAEKLVVHVTNGKDYVFVGPDLDAVTQRSCSVKRCQERCTPAYNQHLKHFDMNDPEEGEVTCEDVRNEELPLITFQTR
jgi:hypothetical protein